MRRLGAESSLIAEKPISVLRVERPALTWRRQHGGSRQRITEDTQQKDCYGQCVASEPRVATEKLGEDLVVIFWESSMSGQGAEKGSVWPATAWLVIMSYLVAQRYCTKD